MSSAPLTGAALLERLLLNKGTAFDDRERQELGLLGLLPPHVETLDEQAARCYEAFRQEPTPLEQHIYLRNLQDENETLFYRVVLDHISEMLPVIYTPVVGEACQKFSHIYRRPRGLFIAYPRRERIDEILDNCPVPDVQAIVVSDGERILGLGDQGAGGMGIPIGKLSLYTSIGGIHPSKTLPIVLDTGTNNEERLADPRYIGWRHERIAGQEYDDFIEQFVAAVMRKFPSVLLQWEDFASRNAAPILARYRDRLCTFNDDIQGTAAVTSGAILAGIAATKEALTDQRVLMCGAGTGVTEKLIRTFIRDGMSEADARSRFFVIDRDGLLHDGRRDLVGEVKRLAQPAAKLASWKCDLSKPIGLAEVVHNVRPTVLVGVTGQGGAFTEAVIREMAASAKRPIIFPPSNPTSLAEATPVDLMKWTDGRALVATGSPFAPVTYGGRTIPIAQCNNSYVFPAMGTAILASRARRVDRRDVPGRRRGTARDFAGLERSQCSAAAAARKSAADGAAHRNRGRRRSAGTGVAEPRSKADLERRIDETMWTPAYVPLRRGEIGSSHANVRNRHACERHEETSRTVRPAQVPAAGRQAELRFLQRLSARRSTSGANRAVWMICSAACGPWSCRSRDGRRPLVFARVVLDDALPLRDELCQRHAPDRTCCNRSPSGHGSCCWSR